MTLVVSQCGCKAVVLRIELTLGTATRLVAWESENRGWFTRKDGSRSGRLRGKASEGFPLAMYGHIKTSPMMP
ncbi:hypothetical protein CRG98_030730 [Punica granatum]|uniref:Uncharacterized protein n=1 Tax=Punica granatum TaxID=22663 RepID=A0A2I0IY04_PUNGR|nr:hypothetical protein CRG98_030730 [Punica granatum]